jgi:hypothetical protein
MVNRICLVALFALAAAVPAKASETRNFLGVYKVSIFGFSIAESRFSSRLDGRDFEIDGTLKSAGLARIFDDTEGMTKVSGYLGQGTIVPVSYQMSYQSGRKRASTQIDFENGRVINVAIRPRHKHTGKNWVPLDADKLAEVTDPLTASMVKANGLADVCNRTLRVFDGEMRADLQLSFLRTRPFSTAGYQGDVVDCKAQFVPVAGYRKNNSGLAYLKAKSRISITFAPLGDSDVYAPVKAEVGTKIGTVLVYATRFGPAE